MKPLKPLFLMLLFNTIVFYAKAQLQPGVGNPLQPAVFPAYNATITSYTVYLNSDSTQPAIETVVTVNLTDTVQINKVHVKIKGVANSLLQQQQVAQLSQKEVYKRSSGIHSPTSYDVYFKFLGNYASERLEVELENRGGAKSTALTVIN
jgi:hypothetical protein